MVLVTPDDFPKAPLMNEIPTLGNPADGCEVSRPLAATKTVRTEQAMFCSGNNYHELITRARRFSLQLKID
jgi:hypothetical protein